MNLLLINQNPIVKKLVSLSAQKAGLDIIEAGSMDSAEAGEYDFVLIDDELLETDKFDTLREQASSSSYCCILAKGKDHPAGFDTIVEKPFLPTELVDMFSAKAEPAPTESASEEGAMGDDLGGDLELETADDLDTPDLGGDDLSLDMESPEDASDSLDDLGDDLADLDTPDLESDDSLGDLDLESGLEDGALDSDLGDLETPSTDSLDDGLGSLDETPEADSLDDLDGGLDEMDSDLGDLEAPAADSLDDELGDLESEPALDSTEDMALDDAPESLPEEASEDDLDLGDLGGDETALEESLDEPADLSMDELEAAPEESANEALDVGLEAESLDVEDLGADLEDESVDAASEEELSIADESLEEPLEEELSIGDDSLESVEETLPDMEEEPSSEDLSLEDESGELEVSQELADGEISMPEEELALPESVDDELDMPMEEEPSLEAHDELEEEVSLEEEPLPEADELESPDGLSLDESEEEITMPESADLEENESMQQITDELSALDEEKMADADEEPAESPAEEEPPMEGMVFDNDPEEEPLDELGGVLNEGDVNEVKNLLDEASAPEAPEEISSMEEEEDAMGEAAPDGDTASDLSSLTEEALNNALGGESTPASGEEESLQEASDMPDMTLGEEESLPESEEMTEESVPEELSVEEEVMEEIPEEPVEIHEEEPQLDETAPEPTTASAPAPSNIADLLAMANSMEPEKLQKLLSGVEITLKFPEK